MAKQKLDCAGTNKGFTLVEMAITILIIVIIAVTAKVKLGPFVQSIRMRSTTDTIKAKIIAARTRAIANPYVHCGVYFKMTSPQSVLLFFDNGAGAAANNNAYDAGADQIYIPAQAPPNKIIFVNPSSNYFTNDALVFRGDGSAKYGGQIEIQDGAGHKRTIDVLPSTGRVKVIVP